MPRRHRNLLLLIAVLAASFAGGELSAQTFNFGGNFSPALTIPAFGTGGSCSNNQVQTQTINVTSLGAIGELDLTLGLTHNAYGDLRVTLSHGGISVVILDGLVGAGGELSDLNGLYTLSDSSIESLDMASVTASGGFIPAGSYRGDNPLSAFDGMELCGPWAITICDDSTLNAGSWNHASLTVRMALSTYGGEIIPALSIPPVGTGGGCASPENVTVHQLNVNDLGVINDLKLRVTIQHTFYGDLIIRLSHGGVTVVLADGYVASGGHRDLCGTYTFDDSAAMSLDEGAATSMSTCIPSEDDSSGRYRGDNVLAAFNGLDRQGLWILSICDYLPVFPGTLSHVSLKLSPYIGYSWTITQTSTGSATFTNTLGAPGARYLNALTGNSAFFPNHGWFFGIEISITDLLTELNAGPPFFGVLDSCGQSLSVLPGPIPSGLTVYCVGLQFDPVTGGLSSVTAPFSYTTL